MAGESAQSHIRRFLNEDAPVIVGELFEGISDGTNFPDYLIPLIAQIPDLDEEDGRMGWLPFVDSLDEVINEAPQDLTEEDVETLKAKITDYIRNAETPEQLENAARFYMHANYGENYAPPDNGSAFSELGIISLQGHLSRMTVPNASTLEGNSYPILGINTQRFEPSLNQLNNPVNPEFINALSDAIEQLQIDMRLTEQRFGSSLEDTPVDDMENVGLDRAGYIGEQTETYLERYQTYLAENKDFDKNDVRERFEQFQILTDLLDGLPQEQKDAIDAALLDASRDAPGLAPPSDPNETAPATTPPSPEQIAATALIERTADMMDIPTNIVNGIDAPFILEAVPGAHFHEGFKREMQTLFQEDMIEVYGIRNPVTGETQDRIQQADGDLFRSWFDADNNAYEFIEQPDGSDKLMMVNPDGSLQELPEGQIPTELFEYHIQPDGSIDKYLMGENGQLHENYLDGSPVMLDGQYPNFDIEHLNFVTHRFLQKYNDASWAFAVEDAGLDQYFETRPSAKELETQIAATKTDFRDGIIDYFRGIDDETTAEIDESGYEEALDALTQAVKEHYANTGRTLNDEELDAQVKKVLSGKIDQSDLDGILNTETQNDTRAAADLNVFLVQITAMQNQLDRTTLLDFANAHDSGLLPGGLQGRPLAITEAWRQDTENYVQDGQYRWEQATEYRAFDPLVYDAIVEAKRNDGELTINAFQNDEDSMEIIEELGWQDKESFSLAETGIIAQKLMVSEALDRHNAENPDNQVTDINSAEARAIFVEDFRNGQYNWHDIEIFMSGFDADEVAKQESRARFLAATDESMHDDYAANPDFWYQADDARRRSAQFNDAFGSDTSLELPDGSTVSVENATITRDDAVTLFWRDYTARKEFDYDKAQYDVGYDEMIEILELTYDPNQKSSKENRSPEDFANEIKDIMENTSLYQQFQAKDANNPSGDMETLYTRRYEAAMEKRRELEFKRENDVIAEAEPSVINDAALDPDVDKIVPLPRAPEQSAPQPEFQTAEPPPASRPTPEELNDNCNDITAPSEEVLALCGGGPAIAPNPAQQVPGMAN